MSGFVFTITTAGLNALVDAQNGDTEEIVIAELGLSASVVEVAPTLVALPGEFKRLDMLSGQSASETVIHMTALDASDEAYDVRSVGLFLDDGTLFAAYSRVEAPIFRKVDIATFLFSIDVAFSESAGDSIVFGDAEFLYPPATEETKGVAEIATQDEVDTGTDDSRIVTALKLATRLGPVLQSIADEATARGDGDAGLQALIDALLARTVTGSGLVTGGGDLTASRVLAVLAASAADVIAGTANDRAITPAALGPIVKSLGQNGYISVPTTDPSRLLLLQWGRFTAAANGETTVSFPIAFTQPAFTVLIDGTNETNVDGRENPPRVRVFGITSTSFPVFTSLDSICPCSFFAIGEIDNS